MFGVSIKRLWGSKEFSTYMRDLLASAEGGTAGGFNADVLEALKRLDARHEADFRQLLVPSIDTKEFKALCAALPAIGEKVGALWGSEEFGPYMTELLKNAPGENGKSFPFEVLMGLQTLAEKHNNDFPGVFPAINLWA
ncbi:MAG: hypothetical protein HXX19_03895 [Rhodoferax sp.]|nr:hypothetical protein [Rhodoferax sp.]